MSRKKSNVSVNDQRGKELAEFAEVMASFRDALRKNGFFRAEANSFLAQWLEFYWASELNMVILPNDPTGGFDSRDFEDNNRPTL